MMEFVSDGCETLKYKKRMVIHQKDALMLLNQVDLHGKLIKMMNLIQIDHVF